MKVRVDSRTVIDFVEGSSDKAYLTILIFVNL